MATSVAAGLLRLAPGLSTRLLSASSLHTGLASSGKHHWYPDKEYMRLYEGKALMYRSPARRKNINIPETILHAHDDSPISEADKQVSDDDDSDISGTSRVPGCLVHWAMQLNEMD